MTDNNSNADNSSVEIIEPDTDPIATLAESAAAAEASKAIDVDAEGATDLAGRRIVAVGLGGGGTRACRRFHDEAVELGIEQKIEFLSFDSIDWADSDLPTAFESVRLDADAKLKGFFETHRRERPFIPSDATVDDLTEQGTQRNRWYGRLLGEYHANRLFRMLRETIETALNPGDSELSVIVFTACTGGTGSGSTPVVSVLADQAIDSALTNIDGSIASSLLIVGSVAKLEGRDQPDVPGHPSRFLNQAGLLTELNVLINQPTPDDPLTIEFTAANNGTAGGLASYQFELNSPPFDAIILVPLSERDIGKAPAGVRDPRVSEAEAANTWMASVALTAAVAQDDLENFVGDHIDGNGFYSAAVTEVQAPLPLAQQLIEYQDEIESLAAEQDAVSDEIDALSELQIGLRQFNNWTTATNLPDTIQDGPFSDAVREQYRAAQTVASQLGYPPEGTEAKDAIDSVTVDGTALTTIIDLEIERAQLVELVFYERCVHAINQRLDEHAFIDVFDSIWERYQLEIEEQFPEIVEATREERYTKVLEFLKAKEDQLAAERGVMSLFGPSAEEERVQKYRTELRREYAEFRQLRKSRDEFNQRITQRRQALNTAIESLEDAIQAREERRSTIDASIEQLEAKAAAARSILDDGRLNHRLSDVPLELPPLEELSQEAVNADSIADLLNRDLLDEQTLAAALSDCIDTFLSEPFEDDFSGVSQEDAATYQPPSGPVAVLTAEANKAAGVTSLNPESGPNVGAALARQCPDQDRLQTRGVDGFAFTIRVVSLFAPISPEYMTEVSWIRELQAEGDLNRLFGGAMSGHTSARSGIAYPEFVEGRISDADTRPAQQSLDRIEKPAEDDDD